MDSAIETLRVEFEKACAELSFIEAKVESEFTRKFELERHAPLNPYKALTRLKKLKQTLQVLKVENERIMAEKQEFIRDTDAQLAVNNELLLKLQMQAGIQPDGEVQNRLEYYNSISESWREDIINYQGGKYQHDFALEELLPTDEKSFIAISAAIDNDGYVGNEFHANSNPSQVGADSKIPDNNSNCVNILGSKRPDNANKDEDKRPQNVTTANSNNNKENRKLDTKERRLSKSFVAVTQEEFDSVSELVRTRKLTLASVNKIYRTLWDHFKKNPESPPLTIQHMTQMGLKITGVTGEANLKVLRSLKIIRIEKSGVSLIR